MGQDGPKVALTLGALGLLPFLGATGALFVLPAHRDASAGVLLIYAVAILSFLGGVHWGRALGSTRAATFVWSVAPSLLAFFAAMLAQPLAHLVLSGGFVLAGAVDVALFRRTGPRWYARLRLLLTVVVAACLAAAAVLAPERSPLLGTV